LPEVTVVVPPLPVVPVVIELLVDPLPEWTVTELPPVV